MENRIDINRSAELNEEVSGAVDDMFEYHKWTDEQVQQGTKVRSALCLGVKIIIANVPPSPDRTVAIRKLREACMDCNSAITHQGKY